MAEPCHELWRKMRLLVVIQEDRFWPLPTQQKATPPSIKYPGNKATELEAYAIQQISVYMDCQ